jgi:hypothetical protein
MPPAQARPSGSAVKGTNKPSAAVKKAPVPAFRSHRQAGMPFTAANGLFVCKRALPFADGAPLFTDSGLLSVDNGALSVDNGSLSVDNGSLSIDNGSLSVDSGALSVDSGGLSVNSGAFLTVNGALFMDKKLTFKN